MKSRKLPKLRKITLKNKKYKYKLSDSKRKRRLAINEGVKNESKKLNVSKKIAAQKKKGRFNILRIYRKNNNKKDCLKFTQDMQYMDKKYKLGKTKNICKTKKKQKGGVLSRDQATALEQSIKKIINKNEKVEIPKDIIKLISDKVVPKINENLKKELLEEVKDRLLKKQYEDEDEIDYFEEDEDGMHINSDMLCMGCESGLDNTNAHCTACREGRL